MNRLPLGAISVCIALQVGTSPVSAVEKEVKQSPVDFRACNFREGKGMQDLQKVNAKFRDYANKNDFAYAAWVLTPEYHAGAGFDVGWLGAWPDSESFGVSMEKWNAPGNPIAAEFEARMIAAFKAVRTGPGSDPRSEMGCLIDEANRARVEALIEQAAELVMAACDPAEDLRGDAEYKTHMAAEMARRSIRDALERARS